MCYEDDDRPPYPPIRGGADAFGALTLTADDGVEFDAFFAHPSGRSERVVVILPDFRGLGDFYQQLTVRFAEAGFHAVAIDYYTRELGRGERPLAAEEGGAALQKTNKADVDRDVAAAIDYLHGLPGVPITSVFVVGFCLGGTLAWHQTTTGHAINGVVSFYGVMRFLDESRVDEMHGPMLMLIAGQDREPSELPEGLADKIRAKGESVETHVYPNAPHSFFLMDGEFGDECDDAWKRVLEFCDEHETSCDREEQLVGVR